MATFISFRVLRILKKTSESIGGHDYIIILLTHLLSKYSGKPQHIHNNFIILAIFLVFIWR